MSRSILAAAALLFASAAPALAAEWQFHPVDTGGCLARLEGVPANINASPASNGRVLLAISRKDWNFTQPNVTVKVGFDGAPAVEMRGLAMGPAVLVVIEDPAAVARLKAARTIDWTLPHGQFRTGVEGIGPALDRAPSCGR